MNDDYWYNLKEENGSVVIDKVSKEKKEEPKNEEKETPVLPKKNKSKKSLFIIIPILIIVPIIAVLIINMTLNNSPYKYRTFMLYMVGSDLESDGSMATFDLNDIKGSNIDLKNNNVILMVGGSKKWHNFVNEDEVGIYELTSSGFSKLKSYDVTSMGSSNTLNGFLNFVTEKYESEKYDMIFWNHGLGSVGLEVDELSDDYLNITELKSAFDDSIFANQKLELVIFNNCLSGNIHFASVMKNYAEYMVASEEIMYVGSPIDRLNFLNDVEKDNNGYDIGLLYVNRSDKSIKNLNNTKYKNLDSTLSIIDLSKIDEVEKSMGEFFNSIELDDNYRSVSFARRRTNTYGVDEYDFDTVDLYSFAEKLSYLSNNEKLENLKDSIKSAVVYNSSFNSYSNGLSVYFPYYGSDDYISTHLYAFDKLWNNDYLNFINKYVELTSSAKRAKRAGVEDKILLLENDIKYDDKSINIELTDEEKDSFQDANIYLFEKKDNKYKLLLKSNDYNIENNVVSFNNIKLLKTSNNEIVSSIYEKEINRVYGLLNEIDVVVKVQNDEGKASINNVLVDSKDKPVGGLIEFDNESINYYSTYYSFDTDVVDSEWKENSTKELLNNINNELIIEESNLKDFYVLIEINDINNDELYSKIIQIK